MRDGRADHIKDVNVRYHDVAAGEYDVKWGINYEESGRSQVVGKLRKALDHEAPRFARSLEIGAGTGYFSLNLLRAGVIERAVATDISQGMLDELSASAGRLGLDIETVRCEAASLPFDEDSFDLVLGHAVLHHLPDLDAAFAEFRRVLRPGGTVVFCGEPSRTGNRLAEVPKRVAMSAAPLWRRAMRTPERSEAANEHSTVEHALEFSVDVHAFTPADLEGPLRRTGFETVRVSGEELASSWFGWLNRTLESTAEPLQLPRLWYQYACRGYLFLQRVDRAVLEPRLPATVFYNLLVSARTPAGAAAGVRPVGVPQPVAAAAVR